MSDHRSLPQSEPGQNRDPRQRDRSRSEIRRPDTSATALPSLSTHTPSLKSEQSSSPNGVLDFLKTLGLSSQLVQALINANPPRSEFVQQQPQQNQSVNNAQEFALFLNQNYGLNSTIVPTTNPTVNRDPRRRQVPQKAPSATVSTPSHPEISNDVLRRSERSIDPRAINNNLSNTESNSISSMSIEESYRQYLSQMDSSLFDDETRQRLQRIALLDSELDKLHRMNIELAKNSERRSRRRTSAKDKDPLLKENELLQHELIDYIKTLKTAVVINCSTSMSTNSTIFGRH